MICCWGTLDPSRNHGVIARASVSILSSWAGPQVCLPLEVLLFRRCTALGLATHSFQIQRHRFHSASRAVWAVDDTSRRRASVSAAGRPAGIRVLVEPVEPGLFLKGPDQRTGHCHVHIAATGRIRRSRHPGRSLTRAAQIP
ncbi:predicted protein [Streptomyces iranensis]|uniref:Uncharacterized protein n=1 Tax=Streptomyces iranensis TaxID=576784 RepID=A0A061A305_9ACTN|nr:predicted protein [Streptomyces iranensis]